MIKICNFGYAKSDESNKEFIYKLEQLKKRKPPFLMELKRQLYDKSSCFRCNTFAASDVLEHIYYWSTFNKISEYRQLSLTFLEEKTGLKRKTIQRALDELKRLRIIKKVSAHNEDQIDKGYTSMMPINKYGLNLDRIKKCLDGHFKMLVITD